METIQCKRCGKIIEGFSHKDLKHRMLIHSTTHMAEERKQEQINEQEVTNENNGEGVSRGSEEIE